MDYGYNLFCVYFPVKMKRVRVSASLLSADFSKLEKEIKSVDRYVDEYHLDVMDGCFVPNLTIGPVVVKSIRKCTKKPFDVHLMINDPMKYVDAFVDAGADMITFHYETADYFECRDYIRSKKVKVGIAYNPDTDIKFFNSHIDRILIMSVYPGFAGQKFIEDTLEKISDVKERRDKKYFSFEICVDGGVNSETSQKIIEAGADVLVSGSYLFKAKDRRKAIKGLKERVYK